MPVATRLQIDLRPFLWLASVLGVVHALALASVWVSLEGWPRYLGVCGVLISAAECLRGALRRTSRSAVSLELLEDGQASWKDRGANWHAGKLGEDNFVSVALVVMQLNQTLGGRKWLVLAADSGASEDLRRLRAWLRWRREAAERGRAGAGSE